MVQKTYAGVTNAKAEFEGLKPAVEHLRKMQMNCRPFGRDYLIIAAAIDGLDTAAYHFLRHPRFFGIDGHGHGS